MSLTGPVPVLETTRLVLRAHRLDDLEDCARMWSDPRVVAHISGVPSTKAQSWTRIMRYAGFWHHLGFGYWVVTSREDGTFLGEVGFGDFYRNTTPDMSGVPEAGWVFNTSAHGCGFATEAVTAMMHWADTSLPHSRTMAVFDPGYRASLNVARKVGFSNEIMGRFDDQDALFMERARKTTLPRDVSASR